MMKNILNRTFLSLILFLGVLINAQTQTETSSMPTLPPPGEETGEIGGISQPIDMYVIWLAVIAMLFIVYYVKQNNKKIA